MGVILLLPEPGTVIIPGKESLRTFQSSVITAYGKRHAMKVYLIYIMAALAEIAGCFAFWGWLRLEKPIWWLLPGMASLAAFAWLLTMVPTDTAGRAYAAYGGIYIVASLGWLWSVEGRMPDRWDMTGGLVCLCGASLILFGPRS